MHRAIMLAALCLSPAPLIGGGVARVDASTMLPSGGSTTVMVAGTPLQVFGYRPGGCRPAGLLIVFHGLDRNADTYRDDARPLADRLCLVVAAPLFDAGRFPTWRYQRGGIANDGAILPPSAWTVSLVAPMVEALRAAAGTGALPVYLAGHSAGAQFLGRVAAYARVPASRIVIANPSTYVLPSLSERAPYGFGGLPTGEAMLRAYLAAPVTLLLGDEDTGDRNLVENAEAMRQGTTRLDRGRRTFAAAQATARQHGWPFGWRLAEVPGIGHSARSMLASAEAAAALGEAR